MSHDQRASSGPERCGPVGCETSRVERGLTPAELEREILCARVDGSSDVDGGG